jgi:DNA-binding winged helix-turn-helix (wHTH) protein/TolB-like protein
MSLNLKLNVDEFNLSPVKPSRCSIYEFEDFRLDAQHLMLYRNGDEISLTPKQVETLLALTEHSGEIVSKEVLMTRLWGNTTVEESNLVQNIHFLRKVLGETSDGKPMIETLRRRGYRFNGEIKLNVDRRRAAHVLETPDTEPTSIGAELPISKRRKGFILGSKIFIAGIIVGFVFWVCFQVLRILGGILMRYEVTATGAPRTTYETIVNLLGIFGILAGIGIFVGTGLSLFGVGRLAYTIFERENSKIRTITVERIMAGVICLLLLSVAIPNLIYSYREAYRVRHINQALNEKRSVAVLPFKPAEPGAREEIYEFGIPESINAKINAVTGFRSRSLNTMRRYAELEPDAFASGRDFDVEFVLRSSYEVVDGQISVKSELLNIASGTIDDTFEVTADSTDAIKAQETVATFVADKFLARFGSQSGTLQVHPRTNN